MAFEKEKWNEAPDGSAMKVTDTGAVLKTERISSRKEPHTHDIVNVERTTGKVKEISLPEKRL
jgi:hypothetical protein